MLYLYKQVEVFWSRRRGPGKDFITGGHLLTKTPNQCHVRSWTRLKDEEV